MDAGLRDGCIDANMSIEAQIVGDHSQDMEATSNEKHRTNGPLSAGPPSFHKPPSAAWV